MTCVIWAECHSAEFFELVKIVTILSVVKFIIQIQLKILIETWIEINNFVLIQIWQFQYPFIFI